MVAKMASSACRFLFVDDHPLVLSGLSDILSKRGYSIETSTNLASARRMIEDQPTFDAIIMDINLGTENGLDLLEYPPRNMSQRVVLLSGVMEQETILRGLHLGAIGFIPKSIELEEFILALILLLEKPQPQGSGWIWNSDIKQLSDALDYFPRESVLTPKEREVFMLLRSGKLDKQIAAELGLSIHTIRVHVRAIKRKRGHNRRTEQNY